MKVKYFDLTKDKAEDVNKFVDSVDLIGQGLNILPDGQLVVVYKEQDEVFGEEDIQRIIRAELYQTETALFKAKLETQLLKSLDDMDEKLLEAATTKVEQLEADLKNLKSF